MDNLKMEIVIPSVAAYREEFLHKCKNKRFGFVISKAIKTTKTKEVQIAEKKTKEIKKRQSAFLKIDEIIKKQKSEV